MSRSRDWAASAVVWRGGWRRTGARLTLADVDGARAAALARELGATVVDPEAIMTVAADVFSPCALGAVLTTDSVAALRVAAVAGGANNQLATPADGDALHARGIVYAPDYVINAGGIINVLRHLDGSGDAGVAARIDGIPARLDMIWNQARATGDAPHRVADRMARQAIGAGNDQTPWKNRSSTILPSATV